MGQIDFENERGVRLKAGTVGKDAINLEQLLEVREELAKKIDDLINYTLNIVGNSPLSISMTAGEGISKSDLCYLKSDGKMYRANATDDTKSTTLICVASVAVPNGELGRFFLYGRINFVGLSSGTVYYLGLSDGSFTTTPPSTSNNIVRVVGYALSTTDFFLNIDPTWVKIK